MQRDHFKATKKLSGKFEEVRCPKDRWTLDKVFTVQSS